MAKTMVVTLLLLVFWGHGYAQTSWQAGRDSLLRVLRLQKEDSDKIVTLITVGGGYEANNPDSAVYFYKQAGTLCQKTGNNHGMLRYLACMVEIFETQAKFDSALQYCLQGIALSKKIHNRHALAAMYNNAASIYGDLGQSEKVLEYYQSAVVLYEQLKSKIDSANIAIVYSNILGVYAALELHEKAYQYGLKAVNMGRLVGAEDAVLVGLINLDDVLIKLKRYDTAMIIARQILQLGEKLNDYGNTAKGLGNINQILLLTKNIAPVLKNAAEMERLSLAAKDVEGLASAFYFSSLYYLQNGQYALAKQFALKELDIVNKNSLKGTRETEVHQLLGDIGLATNNLDLFNTNRHISDSLQDYYVSGKILKYTQQLQAQYSLDKKQAEITTLKKEQQIQQLTLQRHTSINIALALLVVVVVVIGSFVYSYIRQKNKILSGEDVLKQQRIAKLEKERQLLAAEYVLQGQDEERKRLAKDLHDGLGGILSTARFSFTNAKSNLAIPPELAKDFDRGMDTLDKSIAELRRVAHNMMPESLLNYGLDTAVKEYCKSIEQAGALKLTCQSFGMGDETITKNRASVIYRIIQELVNNILKHANAKTAVVQMVYNEERLHITVEDDGRGFNTAILQNNNGIGYISLQNRVAYLNGSMDINTAPGNGTSITINIPNSI